MNFYNPNFRPFLRLLKKMLIFSLIIFIVGLSVLFKPYIAQAGIRNLKSLLESELNLTKTESGRKIDSNLLEKLSKEERQEIKINLDLVEVGRKWEEKDFEKAVKIFTEVIEVVLTTPGGGGEVTLISLPGKKAIKVDLVYAGLIAVDGLEIFFEAPKREIIENYIGEREKGFDDKVAWKNTGESRLSSCLFFKDDYETSQLRGMRNLCPFLKDSKKREGLHESAKLIWESVNLYREKEQLKTQVLQTIKEAEKRPSSTIFTKAKELAKKFQKFIKRLKGKILLQVEDKGQAYYVDPKTEQRAFLGRPADAFKIMSELGLGITNKNLARIANPDEKDKDLEFAKGLTGMILLQVEKNGEAYYVSPTDLKKYFLGRPKDAFDIMRGQGLGITNEDIDKVPVFQKYETENRVADKDQKKETTKKTEQTYKVTGSIIDEQGNLILEKFSFQLINPKIVDYYDETSSSDGWIKFEDIKNAVYELRIWDEENLWGRVANPAPSYTTTVEVNGADIDLGKIVIPAQKILPVQEVEDEPLMCSKTFISFPENGSTFFLGDPVFSDNTPFVFYAKNPNIKYSLQLIAKTPRGGLAGIVNGPPTISCESQNWPFFNITTPGEYALILYAHPNTSHIGGSFQTAWDNYINNNSPAPADDFYVSTFKVISDKEPAKIVIEGFSVTPTSVKAGDSVKLQFALINEGETISSYIPIRVILSVDSSLTTEDTELLQHTFRPIKSWGSTGFYADNDYLNVNIPSSIKNGGYYIGILTNSGLQTALPISIEEKNITLPKPADNNNSWVCGDTLTDPRDSKTYSTVLIGSQCWLAENINVGTMTAGVNKQGTACSSTAVIEKYCYDDTESYCASDGALYRWDQAMCGAASCNGTGESQPACSTPVQGICPDGWHIPSDYEYVALEREVCDSSTCAADFPYNEAIREQRGTDEGTQLKVGGSSGFEGLLTGFHRAGPSYSYYRGFYYRGSYAYFWSSLEAEKLNGALAWKRWMYSGYAPVFRVASYKSYGYSVRCLKD